MIAVANQQGLIIATRSQTTAPFDELIACCGWPVLLQATPQRVLGELLLRVPHSTLFWLDDPRDVAPTTRLLTWLGASQPTVGRIAVAYQLAADVELAVRSANVHLYLAADRNIRALVEDWLPRWLAGGDRRVAESSKLPVVAASPDNWAPPPLATLHSWQPP